MKRFKHRLSHHRLASFDMGELVPVACVEVLPGDTFRHSSSALLRVASLANPVMHPVSARLHHWFVPTRVVYEATQSNSWEDFMNNNDTPDSIKDLAITDVTAGTLLNHLGIPALSNIDMSIVGAPVWAYNMIWNSYYRDQELQSAVALTNTTLQRVCWQKDYFTTARTYPQYGDTTISIPFQAGLNAPVELVPHTEDTTVMKVKNASTGASAGSEQSLTTNSSGDFHWGSTTDAVLDPNGRLIANLADATGGGIDVNDFRRAIALQRFLEARARYGARYRDYLRYLGIRARDGRLQEPEYLGGGKQTIAFSEVIATAEGTSTEVGDLAGHGIAALRTRPYTHFFEEHGFVLSLMSVRPKTIYMEQLNRHWLRSTRDDYWQKEYEAFGPQAVTNKEVYAAAADETGVFGYVDRFREYREHPSYVSGLFGTTMDDWHYAREFGTTPTLNSDFVACAPTDRVYNDANSPELFAMVNHSLVARRLVSARAR